MTFISYQSKTYQLSQEESADPLAFVINKFGLSPEQFYLKGGSAFLKVCPRIVGGKGGFGRAMLQEGRRRSRRLPEHKDACLTLSGKRVGQVRAKQRIRELKPKIKELKERLAEQKAVRKRSNKEKEMEKLENQEVEIRDAVYQAVEIGISKLSTNEEQNTKPDENNKIIAQKEDFDILFED